MTYFTMFISLLLLITINGCDNSEKSEKKTVLTATATAVFNSDGTTTREANSKEIQRMEKLQSKLNEINQKYPAPMQHAQYSELELHIVKSVNDQGHIFIENGTSLALEGLRCDLEMTNYLRKSLLAETVKIAYLPSANKGNIPKSAYIWEADFSIMQDPELKDIFIGPSYSSINEIGIANGWCTVVKTENSKYYKRFFELQKLSCKQKH